MLRAPVQEHGGPVPAFRDADWGSFDTLEMTSGSARNDRVIQVRKGEEPGWG